MLASLASRISGKPKIFDAWSAVFAGPQHFWSCTCAPRSLASHFVAASLLCGLGGAVDLSHVSGEDAAREITGEALTPSRSP